MYIVCNVQEVAAALQGSRILTDLLSSWLQRQPLLPGTFKDNVQGVQRSTAGKAVTRLLAYIQDGPLAPGVGLPDDMAYFSMSCNEDIMRCFVKCGIWLTQNDVEHAPEDCSLNPFVKFASEYDGAGTRHHSTCVLLCTACTPLYTLSTCVTCPRIVDADNRLRNSSACQ